MANCRHVILFLVGPWTFLSGPVTADSSIKKTHSIAQWLRQLKVSLPSIQCNASLTVHAVMGNEAGDLDSLASAIAYASLQRHMSSVVESTIWVPVYNVPHAELHLRRDIVEVLRLAGIVANSIICIDNPNLNLLSLNAKHRLRLTLVDHNALSPRQDALASSVVGIVDHHRDAGMYQGSVANASRVVVFPVGSCCTLISEFLFKVNASALLHDRSLSLLIVSAIELDTKNLDDSSRTTPRDRSALSRWWHHHVRPWGSGIWPDSDSWYRHLKSLRQDLSGFSFMDVMRKDLKFARIGNGSALFAVASTKATWEDLSKLQCFNSRPCQQSTMLQDLAAFMADQQLSAFFALMHANQSSTKRLLASTLRKRARTLGPRLVKALAEGVSYGGIKLLGTAVPWHRPRRQQQRQPGHPPSWEKVHNSSFVATMFEFNRDAGRKQVLPFLEDVFAANLPREQGMPLMQAEALAPAMPTTSLVGVSHVGAGWLQMFFLPVFFAMSLIVMLAGRMMSCHSSGMNYAAVPTDAELQGMQ